MENGKMKALVAYGKDEYRLDEVEKPIAGPGELVLEVEACGICAGDAKAWMGAPRFWGDGDHAAYVEPPAIPGHEFVGCVVSVGDGAEGGFQVGDRVVSEQIVPCGQCRYCQSGQYSICEKHDVYGFKHYLNGGMAKYVKLPKGSRNYLVPADLPLEQAVLIEPYACSMHCIDVADIREGDVVVLAGAGTLGLGMVGAARLRNPGKLIVLDMMEERLALARSFGADVVMNPARTDVLAAVRELTGGYGCDIYIEATGHPSAVQQGLDMLRKRGTFVEFSVFKDPAVIDWSIIGDGKELIIKGVSLSPDCYERVIRGIHEGKLPTEGVVTHRYALDDWKEAFETAAHGKGGAIKVVLTSK